MNFEVRPHIIDIIQNELVNENELNVNKCYFTFSEEYTNDLVKVAVFLDSEGNCYQKAIIDNQCDMPYINYTGRLEIGVYAFSVDLETGNKTIQYSPIPVAIAVQEGSYIGSTEEITPTQFEQYMQALNDGLVEVNDKLDDVNQAIEEANNLNISISKSGKVATVVLTKKDNTTQTVTLSDGTSLMFNWDGTKLGVKTDEDENYTYVDLIGPQGNTGATGNGISNIVLNQDYTLTINYTNGTSTTTSSIRGATGETGADAKINGSNTINIVAGTNISLTQDGTTLTIDNTYDDSTISGAISSETTNRQTADNNLQSQIDAITSASDVVDVVGAYSDLQNYDTSSLTEDDVIKVMQDSTHSDALSYYRWVVTNNVGDWSYIGSEGPFYTKSEADALLNAKVGTSDYATSQVGGVIKIGVNGTSFDSNNRIQANKIVYDVYQQQGDTFFIGKGTLENVISGKNLETADNKVTSLNSSSSDTEYPSAKCVYASQEEQNEELALLATELEDNTITVQDGTQITDGANYYAKVDEVSGGDFEQNTSILPSEYTQVDYLESSGTQYIDTGVKGNGDTRVIIDYQVSGTYTIGYRLFGSREGVKLNGFFISSENDTTIYVDYYNSASRTTFSPYDRHIIDHSWKTYLDGNLLFTFTKDVFTTPNNLILFGGDQNGTIIAKAFKVWSCKIYNDTTLIRDLIPCYRNSDNEVGMYDIVNNVFYTNAGTGSFTYGSAVTIPNPDYPQDVKTVTGSNSVKMIGNNLLNPFDILITGAASGGKNVDTGGYVTAVNTSSDGRSSTYADCDYKLTLPAGTYNLLIECAQTSENANGLIRKSDGNEIFNFAPAIRSIGTSTRLFTLTETTDIGIFIKLYTAKVRLSILSSSTSYIPYSEQTYPLSLGDIFLGKIPSTDYENYIAYEEGNWYFYKNIEKYAFSSNETGSYQSNFPRFAIDFAKGQDSTSSIAALALCTHLKVGQTATTNNTFGISSNVIYIRNEDYTTLSELNDWFSNNDVNIYFILATTSKIQITDATLLPQLNALRKTLTYQGITNFVITAEELSPILDLTYKKSTLLRIKAIEEAISNE